MFIGDPDDSGQIYFDGTLALESTADGGASFNTEGTGFTGIFDVYNGGLTDRVQIAMSGSGGAANLRNRVTSGHLLLQATDASGVLQTGFEFDADTGVGFNGITPIAQPDYTITNGVTNRSINVGTINLADLAEVVGTVIQDLINYGLYQ